MRRRSIWLGLAILGALGLLLFAHRRPFPPVQSGLVGTGAEPTERPPQPVLRGSPALERVPEAHADVSVGSAPASRPPALRGLVRTHRGAVVPQAHVAFVRSWRVPELAQPSVSAISDVDGAFTLDEVPDDSQEGWLLVEAPGWQVHATALEDAQRENGRRIVTLPGGSVIRGTVLDPRGVPIAGAIVQARGRWAEDLLNRAPNGVAAWLPKRTPAFAQATSSHAGTFVLHGLEGGDYELVAARLGYTSMRPPSDPQIVGADQDDIVVVLQPLHWIRVVCVDDDTGAIIPFGTYDMRHQVGQPWIPRSQGLGIVTPIERVGQTDAVEASRQAFVLAEGGDPAATIIVRARAPGYTSKTLQLRPVADGEHVEEVRLRPAPETVAVRFESGLRAAMPVTGGFQLDLGRWDGGPAHVMLQLVDGRSLAPMRLPRGVAHLDLRGMQGSFCAWDAPLGRNGRRPRVLQVDLEGEREVVVTLPLVGAPVLIAPTSQEGDRVGEFTVSQRDGEGFSLRTWNAWPALERVTQGPDAGSVILWMSPGRKLMVVAKRGYVPQQEWLEVPADGSVVRWAPRLQPESDAK